MKLIEKIKYVIENTDLFIQANGTDPNIVSDFGRAKFIDLERRTVKFSRAEVVKRRLNGEMAFGMDAFLRTELPVNMVSFQIIKNYCQDEGSWQRWQMDNFKEQMDWDVLYDHIQKIEINKNWYTKLKHWLKINK